MRVPKASTVASRGQREGTATEVIADVPCSIETLSGRELETARQLYAEAALRVRMIGDSSWNLSPADYLVRDPEGTRIDIGHVSDPEKTGDYEYTLLCAEEVAAA